MKKSLLIFGLVIMLTGGLFAQATKDVTMTVTLKAWYDLSLSRTTITFDDVQPAISATPGTQSIAANGGAVNVRAFAVTRIGQDLNLNITANNDLTSTDSDTIGIEAISWTASGTGFANGTLAKTSVSAGSWNGSVLHWHEGSFSFSFLRNYATQAPGDYSATATYTLSAV